MSGSPAATVLLHEAAAHDYGKAIAWYRERSLSAAAGFELSVIRALTFIAKHPEASPLRDPRHRYRRLRRYPYGLVNRVVSDGIRVVAEAHDRQLPGFWLDRAFVRD